MGDPFGTPWGFSWGFAWGFPWGFVVSLFLRKTKRKKYSQQIPGLIPKGSRRGPPRANPQGNPQGNPQRFSFEFFIKDSILKIHKFLRRPSLGGKSGCATVRRGASGSSPRPFRGVFGTPKSALGELSELQNLFSEPFERPIWWHVRFQSWSSPLRSTRDG